MGTGGCARLLCTWGSSVGNRHYTNSAATHMYTMYTHAKIEETLRHTLFNVHYTSHVFAKLQSFAL